MKSTSNWQQDTLPFLAGEVLSESNYKLVEGVVCRNDLHVDIDNSIVWQDSAFLERAAVPFSTTSLETLQLKSIIDQTLENAGVDSDSRLLDVGCSDGRITKHLLTSGYNRVTSCDIEFPPVYRFRQKLNEEEAERTLLLVDDVNSVPFPKDHFDAIIAWGIVSQTPDPKATFANLLSLLSDRGILLFAEPLLEQALIYALVRSDPEEFLRTLHTGTRPSSWDQRDVRYRVWPMRHYRRFLEGFSVEIRDQGGVSMLPSLTIGGLFQEVALSEQDKSLWTEELVSSKSREIEMYRQYYWAISKK